MENKGTDVSGAEEVFKRHGENQILKHQLVETIQKDCLKTIQNIGQFTCHYLFTDDLCKQLKTRIDNEQIENSLVFLPNIQDSKDADIIYDASGISSILYVHRDYYAFETNLDCSDALILSLEELQNKIKSEILEVHDKLIASREITSWFCYKSPYISQLTKLSNESGVNEFDFLPNFNLSNHCFCNIYKSNYAYYFPFIDGYIGYTSYRHYVDDMLTKNKT